MQRTTDSRALAAPQERWEGAVRRMALLASAVPVGFAAVAWIVGEPVLAGVLLGGFALGNLLAIVLLRPTMRIDVRATPGMRSAAAGSVVVWVGALAAVIAGGLPGVVAVVGAVPLAVLAYAALRAVGRAAPPR
jgi:hypothetical protein